LLFNAYHLFDTGRCDEAIASLEAALEVGKATIYEAALNNELASFYAWCHGNHERATELLAAVKPAYLGHRFVYDRARAVTALAAGRPSEARDALAAAQAGLANEPTAGEHMYLMEREWQSEIGKRLEAS
jgi:hypothetical protein